MTEIKQNLVKTFPAVFTVEAETQNYYTVIINNDLSEPSNLTININPNSNGLLILNLEGRGRLHLNLKVGQHSQWSYLFINSSNCELIVEENIDLQHKAEVKATYGEFNRAKQQKMSIYNLIGEDAYIEIISTSLVLNELTWQQKVYHKAKKTYSSLKNYAVVFENASVNMDVLGHILKSCYSSAAHQQTRILNMNKGKKANVYPKLIIDENDVQASHAASVGQLDEESIYYLKSRGLKHEQVMALISIGYLSPVLNIIKNDKIKQSLQDLIKECINDKYHA